MDDETPRREPGFETHADLIGAEPKRAIIHGFLMEHTVVTVWGVEGHGKSLLVKSWMMACIRGATYNGKPARRGSVVYLAWEGRRKYTGERQEAWLRYYRYAVADVEGFKAQHFSDPLDEDCPLGEGDLFSPRGREQLAARIEADPSYGPPVMVVLDTGTSLVEGMMRKHSQQAWIEVAKLCRWLTNRLRTTVVVLLHANKSGKEPSGAVGFLLAIAATKMSCVTNDETNRVMVHVAKQRSDVANKR